jgi:diaminohydroxyphosphoribosylaminopyrimidine deaminase / 5-amino-6-(5-phosphoribosylamino)uracil reductase
VPARGHLFDTSAPTVVATTERASEATVRSWEAAGAEVLVCEEEPPGRVSLAALIAQLGKRDVQGLLLEGGATLAWGAVAERVIDDVVLYLAPKLLGGKEAPSIIGGAGLAPIAEALQLEFTSAEPIGPDLKVVARVHGDHRRAR